METHLADFIKATPEGIEADRILRSCVHCGFCTATCPTYQLLGDELDGPRGRIYLIKQVLEGAEVTASTRLHMDRCLTCRACETTCPSGVQYGRLADIGRSVIEARASTPRPAGERIKRAALRFATTRRWLFDPTMRLGQSVRPLLPAALKSKVPARRPAGLWPTRLHARRMLLLEGCVQPAMVPNINRATARVLDALGISVEMAPKAGCCGAIQHHLADPEGGLSHMRQNIDAWLPYLDQGVTTLVVNASGCGAMIKDYGHLLAHDKAYAAAAARVSLACRDLAEVMFELESELSRALAGRTAKAPGRRLAFHPPCTLQHGMQIRGTVEAILRSAGYEVRLARDAHLCCGSAGTYSMMQPEIAGQLQADKLAKLEETEPACIVSANIGCIAHLQAGTATPVRHWIEVIDQLLADHAT